MKQMGLVLAILLMAALCGCESMVRDTLNVGSGQGQRMSVNLNHPTATGESAPLLTGGESARFTASVIGVNGPFTLYWNFAGAAENVESTLPVQGSTSVDVLLLPAEIGTDYTVTVAVKDSAGITQSDSITFTLGTAGSGWSGPGSNGNEITPGKQNSPPEILGISQVGRIISIKAEDPDNDDLEFSARLIADGLNLHGPFNGWDEETEFYISSDNPEVLTLFTLELLVEDGRGEEDSAIFEGAVVTQKLLIENDHLYAIANEQFVSMDDPYCRVEIVTGETAHPFQYLNGCGVTCNSGASYKRFSMDIGEMDSQPDLLKVQPIDGIWANIDATNFLRGSDGFIKGSDIGYGVIRTDFNVTPLGGRDITAEGALFNFEYEFSQPGIYTLGFEAVNVVSRTYYQDSSAATDFFWSDISNDHQYNTIVVE